MTINIEYETDIDIMLDYEDIVTCVIEQAVDYEKCPYEVEVNVTLTDNESIHEINKQYRDVDRPTDVLSFPMIDFDAPSDFDSLEEKFEMDPGSYFNPDTGELLLGDIVVSVEKVFEQAEAYGHTTTRELAFLVAHSMMHLFGYDHMEEEEARIMETKQEDVLEILGITRAPDLCDAEAELEVDDVDDEQINKMLITKAKAAMKLAYAPYSKFKVGAALITENGKVYTGCNIENASFGATNCAERTAIFKAVSVGDKVIKRIAIVSGKGEITYPCGVCRQVMSEFMDEDAVVVLGYKDGDEELIKEYKFSDLMPYGFNKF